MNPIVEFIQHVSLFSGMSGLELNAIAAFMEPRRYAAGTLIFEQGSPGSEMYLVHSGRVESIIKDKDGGEREVYDFGVGRFFGEMSVIEGEPRSASCRAAEDTELLVLEGIDFYRLVWEHPVIGVRMLSAMAKVMAGWLDEASGFLNDLVRWGETARRRSVTDDLSGLFNRRFLEEALASRFSRSGGSPPHCSLLMLDVDRFHAINEKHGRDAGDAVISTAGAAFGRLVREGDVAARLSGDEFAFFMPEASPAEAMAAAERIRAEAQTLFLEFRAGKDSVPDRVYLSVSIGVASCPADASNAEELYERSDKALFRAKEAGRNRVERWVKTT
ncbi:MAG TPA: GGDEF domain-containing protein [Spirochaetaceae bacterium]|nr:GGDEF domain-containing protein [Spirochaetaceae bacterium]